MRIDYFWKIFPKETPVIVRKCNRCDNDQFVCSEKFRINSNKRMSDVWLIYKCIHCNSTWNLDILCRSNLSKIDPELFSLFQENNCDLAWQYAFDKSTLKRNKVRMNRNVNVEIIDQGENIFQSNKKLILLSIESKYELNIPIKKIVQNKLAFSANQIDRFNESGAFVIGNGESNDLSKRIGNGCILQINLEEIKNFY